MGEKRLWLALLAPLLMSCQVIHGLDGYETNGAGAGGGAGGPSSTSTSTGSSGSDVRCGQRPGPAMIFIPPGAMGSPASYCIDSTEVTMGQYNGWLNANPPPTFDGQPEDCSGNIAYAPDETGNECSLDPFNPTGKASFPVTCIDWCDAVAYCAWAGKHLCGRIGGGEYDPADASDAAVSEWYRACSHAGDFVYPYGPVFHDQNCGEPGPDGETVSVTSKTKCKGGYEGLFGMSGNVWEWDNICKAEDACLHRGGSFWEDSGELRCDTESYVHGRGSYNTNVGFRCCANPVE
jgi:formylglycine-generating enzyme required for sulfatase activity